MNANTNIHVLHPVLLHSQLSLIFFFNTDSHCRKNGQPIRINYNVNHITHNYIANVIATISWSPPLIFSY